MRVLVIGHTYMTRFSQAKYEALVRADSNVSVLCIVPRQWPEALGEVVAEERTEARFRVVALPTILSGWGSRYFFISPRLPRLFRTFQPEVVEVEHEPPGSGPSDGFIQTGRRIERRSDGYVIRTARAG